MLTEGYIEVNKRTKRKLHNFRLFLIKNVLNGGYLVRNLIISTILTAVVVTVMSLSMFSGNDSKDVENTEVVNERQTIYVNKMDNLNPVSIPIIMADIDTGAEPVVQPNETEMVADVSEENEQETESVEVVVNDIEVVTDTTVSASAQNKKPVVTQKPAEPVTETPSVSQPVTETPATEAPATEAPATEAPATEAPTTEEETTSDNYITVQPTNRGPIVLTQEEINLMACIVTLESGSESYEGQLAVANVILNRLQSGRWGSTVTDVIYAPYQFSSVNSSYLEYYLNNGAYSTSVRAVNDALSGSNNIGDFLYFRAMYIVSDPDSYGTHTIIGNHIFY